MTSDSDDALRWEGDDVAPDRTAALPKGWHAVGKGSRKSDRLDADESETPRDAAPLSTPMLLGVGVIGGIYLLYTVGWVVGGLRLKPLTTLIVADAMFVPWFVLAIAAPALWFVTCWFLTRRRASWVRMLVLLLGAVLLVPWPFVSVGVIGA
ncbi:MAG TPA: hypothetical protein VN241_07995 [Microbacterium sp.]|nr:hypothetical protein [Microbacterium sp.]